MVQKCWYCDDMMVFDKELGGKWLKCKKCNATWYPVPKPGPAMMTTEMDTASHMRLHKPLRQRRSKKRK